MKLYQIVEIAGNDNHAGTKATADIAVIAEKLGFSPVRIRMRSTALSKTAKLQRQIGYLKDWHEACRQIEPHSIVLLQHPFHYPQLTREGTLSKLKEQKHVRYICLVHDVEKLRGFRYNEYYQREFEKMLEWMDVLIVHNDRMADYFEKQGVDRKRIVKLGIFDYLQKKSDGSVPAFAREITVAGNLDTIKCGYIGQLYQLDPLSVRLYGPNFDKKLAAYENIQYGGNLPSDEIPSKLDRGFGLVWDGTSIEGCLGDAGQYLQFNNPHKLSLYLSSGLPVVIWSGAAEAAFVSEHGLGMTAASLGELPRRMAELRDTDYNAYIRNIIPVRDNLIHGYYGRCALQKALELVRR